MLIASKLNEILKSVSIDEINCPKTEPSADKKLYNINPHSEVALKNLYIFAILK